MPSNLVSNMELWNLIRNQYPNFASHTAQGTKELFTTAGYEALKANDINALNEFFELSLRVYLQMVNISNARDPFDVNDIGENFSNPYGGYIQRLAIPSVKPVTPAYKNLQNFNSVDPFVVYKVQANERFFRQNFDYQSLITIPDEGLYRNMFISEYGMSEAFAGWLKGLENGYILQKYTNKLEAINAMLNSTQYPLKDSQQVSVSVSAVPTSEELVNLWLSFKNTISAINASPQTGAFNAMSFASTQDTSRLRLLIRLGLRNSLASKVLASAFNPEQIGLNSSIKIMEVPNFGGLIPYQDEGFSTQLYEVYDQLGHQIGYNTLPNQSEVTVENSNVYWKDPNEDIIAVLMDKGAIFTSTQNPYRVEPIRNPRGLYTNYWASSPNNTVAVDPLFNVIVFRNTGSMGE